MPGQLTLQRVFETVLDLDPRQPYPPYVPTGPKIDYQRALALRCQGFSFKQIAKELGCKYGSLKVGFATKGLARVVKEVNETGLSASLRDKGITVKDRVANGLVRDTAFLGESPPALDHADLRQRYESIEPAVRVARQVFGWDAELPAHTQSINLTSITINPAQPQDVTQDIPSD